MQEIQRDLGLAPGGRAMLEPRAARYRRSTGMLSLRSQGPGVCGN